MNKVVNHARAWSLLAPALLLAAAASGCNGEETLVSCPEGYGHVMADGSCAGLLSTSRRCEGSYCGDKSVSCKKSYHVSAVATTGSGTAASPFGALGEAAKIAGPGDCILLGEGTHKVAATTVVSGGVHVLGVGPTGTTLTPAAGAGWALLFKDGSGGSVRGLGMTGTGIGLAINGTSGLTVEGVSISAATGVGIFASAATKLTIRRTTVRKTLAGKVGGASTSSAMGVVLAKGSGARLERVLLQHNPQIGLFASDSTVDLASCAMLDNGDKAAKFAYGALLACSNVAACKALGPSVVTGVEVARNFGVGVALVGTRATLAKVAVSGGKLVAGVARGIQVQAFSAKNPPYAPGDFHPAALTKSASSVTGVAGQGMVLDTSSATLTGNTISSNAERGVWLQRVSAAAGLKVSLDKNTLDANGLIGLGGTGAEAVSVKGGAISNTVSGLMAVGGKKVTMGDGVQVLKGSKFTVDGVDLARNGRATVVVDASEGSISNCTVDRKDPKADKGIYAQSGAKVTGTGNKDKGGAALAPVNVSAADALSINPDPIWMPAAPTKM